MLLFRPEVLSARESRHCGPVILVRSVSSWVCVCFACLIAVSLLAYLVFGSYTKRATAMGMLAPSGGAVRVLPPISGVIAESRVREGQRVKQGDILFVIANERRIVDGRLAHRMSDALSDSLSQRQASLLQVRSMTLLLGQQARQGMASRLRNLQDEWARSNQEIELQKRRIQTAASMFEKHRSLAQARFISELALQEKEDQVTALQTQLLAMQRQNSEITRNISAVRDELRQEPLRIDSQIATVDRELAELDQEKTEINARDRYAITAPMEALVTAITGLPGQPASGQSLATLLPVNSTLEAHLYLPSRVVGFVEPGQKVRMRYQAYPYQKFGQFPGVVKDVSRNPIQPGELPPALTTSAQEGLYRITVRVESQHIVAYGKKIALLPGMLLDADIEQGRRRLIDWALEPIHALGRYAF